MCCALLNFKLEKSLNDGLAVQFWLFTMRAVSPQNEGIANLKQLFVKFSGCLTMALPGTDATSGVNSVANTIIKRDYIYVEFLKVAQEAILLDMFASHQEAAQLMQFATFKFQQEIAQEQTVQPEQKGNYSSDSGYDSYSDSE